MRLWLSLCCLTTDILKIPCLSFSSLQTHFTKFQLFLSNSSSCYVAYIICASPCGLFLHTAVWVTHQKEDSSSSLQKETRKGLQHIEPINSTPLAVLTFGGVSQWCNWRCKGCCVGDDKILPHNHRAKYNLCCYVNNSLQHNSGPLFSCFFFFYNHGPVKRLLWLLFCNIYSMLGSAEPVKTLKTM